MQVIADPAADPSMGSGAMTITPAHSFIDFELAKKYHIPIVNVIGKDGKLTDAAGSFQGLDVREARRKFVAVLQEKGLVERIDESYVHNLSVCYRCDTPIEPLVAKQWFVAVDKKPKSGSKSLKQRAIAVVHTGKIAIVPDRFNKTYFQWMENLHDWCISRQIWFGHRIPVWYRDAEVYVGIEAPQGKGWTEDPDTLDTWFSSGLWTFSTLGWPMNQSQSSGSGHATKKNDLQMFHPTSVLETGYDILFFWVARMIMMTTYALDEVPFKTVYLHGLVRDKQGRKMSKSLGNGIDPLDVIAKYGADPVRLSLIIGGTPGNDVRLYDEKIAGFRNFVNKLWNIGRFILSQQEDPSLRAERSHRLWRDPAVAGQSHVRDRHASLAMTLSDRWILSRLQKVIASVTDDLEHFRFSHAGETLRDFTWGDFADWYLEIKKVEGDPNGLLLSTYCLLLKLWHPFTPYVTEVLWKQFGKDLLLIQSWPKADKKLIDHEAETAFDLIRTSVMALRNARAIYRIPPATMLPALVVAERDYTIFSKHTAILERLAHLESCRVVTHGQRPKDAVPLSVGKSVLYLLVGGIVDVTKEQERIKGDIEKQMRYVTSLEQRLANEEFTAKAPAEIVEAERAKWDIAREELERLRNFL